MCVDSAVLCLVIVKCLMDTTCAAPTAIKEQEINLRLRIIVPDKSSSLSPLLLYPSITNPSPLPINTYPGQPASAHLQVMHPSQHQYYEPTPVNRIGILRPVKRLKPPVVIHQPVTNYHYHIPATPTRLIPIQVPVDLPSTTSTSRPATITGFNASYDVNYGYNIGTTTPKPMDFEKLLKELRKDRIKAGRVHNKTKMIDLVKDQKADYKIGKLNDDDDEEDDEIDYYDDTDDDSTRRAAKIRSMWDGYVPDSFLEEARIEKVKSPSSKKTSKQKVRKGIKAGKLKDKDGVSALKETIEANENDTDVESTINELHDYDDDGENDSDDQDKNGSSLSNFIDLWEIKKPSPKNESKDQIAQQSESNKHPPSNLVHTNGIRNHPVPFSNASTQVFTTPTYKQYNTNGTPYRQSVLPVQLYRQGCLPVAYSFPLSKCLLTKSIKQARVKPIAGSRLFCQWVYMVSGAIQPCWCGYVSYLQPISCNQTFG